jgi:DNA-binding IclR family transcriptional regulator
MPGDLISPHEVRLLLVFRLSPERWLDNAQVAEAATISPRTARLHTAKLAELGVLDAQRVFPASKFRLGQKPSDAGRDYLDRWEKAREALGITDAAVTGAGS